MPANLVILQTTKAFTMNWTRSGNTVSELSSPVGVWFALSGMCAFRGARMVGHQERRTLHRHNLVTARALRVHLATGDTLEEREWRVAVRARTEPSETHWTSFRRRQLRPVISCTPHPTQNTEPWRRDTACSSSLQWRRGRVLFTTCPHCGQCGTGELARR